MKTTYCIITVDTESFSTQGCLIPWETTVYGNFGGEKYGIERIMSLCERYDCRSTFFVDTLEYRKLTETTVRSACRCISDRGHDVQLHVHANCIPGNRHELIAAYPYEEQEAMIREGKEVIEAWTGRAPIGFRAGSYGANLSTIRALAANDFRIDSSYFTFHKNCELSRQLDNRYKNIVFPIGTVTEIPVTVYKLLDYYLYTEYSKVDINACTQEELCHVIGALAGNVPVLVFFMHSFSFLEWDVRFKRFCPHPATAEKFEAALRFMAGRDDIKLVTLSEYYENVAAQQQELRNEDFVPTSRFAMTFKRVAGRYGRYLQQYAYSH